MASKDSLEVRKLAGAFKTQVSRDDTPVAIRLRTTSAAGAVTSVIVTAATNLVAITAGGGTDTYTFATYATVGALADAINSDGIFEAVVLDALRADSTTDSSLLGQTITAGADGNGVTVWDVTVDTSVKKAMTSSLCLARDFDTPKKGHRVTLKEIDYNLNVSAAEANGLRVYVRTLGKTETQVYGIASVDATKTNITWASGQSGITAPEGADLIVRVQDATSVTDGAGNYVSANGFFE